MKVTKVTNWLSKALFQPQELGNPIHLEIVKYEETTTAKGINRRLSGKHANGKIYEFDIFGDTVGELIQTLGDDSDKWISRKIAVSLFLRGDKEVKVVKILPSF